MAEPGTGRVEIEREGAVAVLVFSNPPHGYMDEASERGLAAALDEVEADAGVHAVVLTGGEPGMFIRHYDVRLLERRGRALAARGLVFTTDRPVPEPSLHHSLRRIEESPKPYIAALNGTAMGGGFELALVCDLRIAQAGDYPLGLPEVNVALLPGAGGTQRLTRLLGQARALELMLTGRTFGPDEAKALGLVVSVVPDARTHALELARELAGKSARALAHIKRLVRGVGTMPAAQGLADERTLFCDLMVQPEGIDAMAAMNRGERGIRDRH